MLKIVTLTAAAALALAVGLVGTAKAQLSCVLPPSDLVSWWPGDGNLIDIQDANDGTSTTGDVTFAAGQVGQAFNFQDTTPGEAHVNVPDADNLRITGAITLDAWVSFSDIVPSTGGIDNAPIVGKWGDTALGTAGYILFVRGSGVVGFALSSDGSTLVAVGSDAALATDTFTHLAGVWTGPTGSPVNELQLYVNGVKQADTKTFTGPINADNGQGVVIGGYDSAANGRFGDSLDGLIDEVEIFDVALSQAEIQAIFNAGTGKCRPASIDIKFCSNPNGHNSRRTKGVVPVTIFGDPGFDVTNINLSTVMLCEAEADPANLTNCAGPPVDSSIADRGDPETDIGASQCAIIEFVEQDFLNPDGLDDLDVAFDAAQVCAVINCAGLNKGDTSIDLVIKGEIDSTEFLSTNSDVLDIKR